MKFDLPRNWSATWTIAAVLACAAAAAITFWPRPDVDTTQAVALPEATEVRPITKVVKEVRYIKVYPDSVKPTLGLPGPVLADPSSHVAATGKLDADERPYTLSAVMNTETGESQVYARPDPLPWLAINRHGEAGLGYGLRDGEPTTRLFVRQDLLQVKTGRVGLAATLDQDGQWFAGVGVWWRW